LVVIIRSTDKLHPLRYTRTRFEIPCDITPIWKLDYPLAISVGLEFRVDGRLSWDIADATLQVSEQESPIIDHISDTHFRVRSMVVDVLTHEFSVQAIR